MADEFPTSALPANEPAPETQEHLKYATLQALGTAAIGLAMVMLQAQEYAMALGLAAVGMAALVLYEKL